MSAPSRLYHAITCTETDCDPTCEAAAARPLRFLDRVEVWTDDAWHSGTVISVGPSNAGIIAGLQALPEGTVRIAVKAQDADPIASAWTITHDLTDPEVAGSVRLAEPERIAAQR